ncbi:MAG: ABC transporter substrate-binding protein [Erythrobacter sp.]|uniref:ABC transporter substrate-binding protein n=1 Tax=Erythrobacter sp. TaxID=1042 RepID=UPI0026385DEF|nr:ABC transporter substrate-binding protein [Erythrobacter sp.]MDJ0979476.1 ABC transporter substrate-binding protein [Erythrobacter sp.]
MQLRPLPVTWLMGLSVLGACSPFGADGPLEVAIVGNPSDFSDDGVRLSPVAQHLRGASREGLVGLDPSGQIVPALAERWIVTDDGMSYIFRLRERSWPDGEPISANDVRDATLELLDRLEGTSLGLDLAKVTEVRAMTEKVVELRLSSPMPEFLRLLAQPELGIAKSGSGAGPMVISLDEDEALVRLSALAPEDRGLPGREDWEESSRSLAVRALPPDVAIDAFAQGDIDLLLNGSISSFPRIELGPLSRGTIQVDPTRGVFGLVFRSDTGLLAEPARREALSMALDREALIEPFGLGGWQPSSWIVPPALLEDDALEPTRWEGLSIEERRAIAAARIEDWRAESGEEQVVLRVGLPPGPGSDLLFDGLSRAWSGVGVQAVRALPGEGAELEWRDRVARYSSPRWYLNQFNCELEVGLCSQDVDQMVVASLTMTDVQEKRRVLTEAHAELVRAEVFIPFGAPVRWSLVRGSISNYQPNPWGLHPLFPLSGPPN